MKKHEKAIDHRRMLLYRMYRTYKTYDSRNTTYFLSSFYAKRKLKKKKKINVASYVQGVNIQAQKIWNMTTQKMEKFCSRNEKKSSQRKCENCVRTITLSALLVAKRKEMYKCWWSAIECHPFVTTF